MKPSKKPQNIKWYEKLPQTKFSKHEKLVKDIREKTEAVADAPKMIEYLKQGNILEATRIKSKIEKHIDPSSIEGYEEAVKECMSIAVAKDEDYKIDSVFILKSDFGEDIDFLSVKGYEDIVKKEFFDYLKKELYLNALHVKDELGEGIDFSKIKGYEKTVKLGFLSRINHIEMEEAFDVVDNFGENIDFSDEIKKAFIYLLKSGFPIEAGELETRLDIDMDLRLLEGYEKAVEQGIKVCLKDHDENSAVLMESNFGKRRVVPLFESKSADEYEKRKAA